MEPMYIKMLIVDKEAFSNSSITIFICLEVKLDLVGEKIAFVRCNYLALISEHSTAVPVLLGLEPL